MRVSGWWNSFQVGNFSVSKENQVTAIKIHGRDADRQRDAAHCAGGRVGMGGTEHCPWWNTNGAWAAAAFLGTVTGL